MIKGNINVIYIIATCILSLLLVFNLQAQDKVNATAIVKGVTIFANAAEISNTVAVSLPKGNSRLLIQNVAQDIAINSVQIAGIDGATILSVSVGRASEAEILIPAHRRLKDSLDIAQAKREVLVNKQKAAQGALKILSNDQLLGAGAKLDMNELTKFVDYYQVKSLELNTAIERFNKSIAEEDKVINRLQKQIQTYVGNGSVLVVQLTSNKAIKGDLALSYMTYAATWQAYYDLKAASINAPLAILYKAKVMQSTGVDWKNVKLILSTGNPAQNGNAPVLNSSYAQFYTNGIFGDLVGRTTSMRVPKDKQYAADGNNMELAEVSVKGMAKGPVTTLVENQLSVTFDIDIPYDILSNGEPHSVTLKESVQPAKFTYYAVPKLDKDAFLLAEITDFEKLNLIAGEANIIFENMLVGSSYINPNVTTDTLILTMGRDKSITVKRDRIMDVKSSQTSGSTKRQTFSYELQVRNGKSTAIDMELKDQYPISTDKAIEIELIDSGGAVVNKETGVLTWDKKINAGETQTYRFTYTIKSPKDRALIFN
ncbi:DUF4139 domain-containing protein [Sphingobacterium rhinopitheci]|uniref:DUF4139 domain-containing protein n=1 Tax=Sphingobacterium rhinopitheci TaxID=2781960 RepID=UPI001F5223E1|nr:DUF4139 domain-containing protein [Sphingobacterium rhinopitheci]MCI0922168.1 DUF4139 domain-containing protein [Sphingobacterium rhinopitheci]